MHPTGWQARGEGWGRLTAWPELGSLDHPDGLPMPFAVPHGPLCWEGHIARDGGSSRGRWMGRRVGNPASPVGPGQGRTAGRDQWGAHDPQHPEPLPPSNSARCPPWAPEAAWPLPALSSCQLVLQAWGKDEAKQNKSSRGISGEVASESLEWLPPCQALKEKKPKQINKPKLKCPVHVQLCTTGCSLPYAPSC